MKKLILATIILTSILQTNAQDTTRRFREMIFQTWVFGNIKALSEKYLVEVSDSGIVLSGKPHPYGLRAGNTTLLNHISYQNIDQIHLKRKGAAGRGILAGILAGAAFGVIAGFASGDDMNGIMSFTASEKALGYGVVAGLAGGIIGGFIGAVSVKKFYINGSPSALKELNISLLERVYGR